MKKILFGTIHVDYLTMDEAVQKIDEMTALKNGGYVVTPNVDHIVIAEKDPSFQKAYSDADLSLADGKPLIWMSGIAGDTLPEKVSGSDIILPVLRIAAEREYKVYLLGGAPGVAEKASEILTVQIPALKIVGTDSPEFGFDKDPDKETAVMAKMTACNPDIVLVALGAPKQELLMQRWKEFGVHQVMIGIGAGLDFISGKVKRAPRWMSNVGLEWVYRISRDPLRLAKRYLIQDLAILPIFFRFLKTPKEKRFSST